MEATEAELQAWVKARLAIFKMPVAIRFVKETLPRNANGEILKKDLKGLFEHRVGVGLRLAFKQPPFSSYQPIMEPFARTAKRSTGWRDFSLTAGSCSIY